MDENPQLEVMLTEYRTLREEVLNAIGHRVAVMNFTFAAISVLLAGLLTRNVADPLAALIAFFAVPQFAHSGLLIWLGEYRRSQRASCWLAGLERRINTAVGADALGWERRSESDEAGHYAHMGYPYLATAAMLLGSAVVALAIGGWLLTDWLHGEQGWCLSYLLPALIGYAVITEGAYVLFFRKKWQEARKRDHAQSASSPPASEPVQPA